MSAANTNTFFTYLDASAATSTIKTNALVYARHATERFGWQTLATNQASTALANTVSYTTARPLRVFYDGRELFHETRDGLRELGGPRWQDRLGTPIAYTMDGEADQTIRLYPRPTVTNSSLAGSKPFGVDFPSHAVTLISSNNSTEPNTILDVITALLMVSYARVIETPHQDREMALVCEATATVLAEIINRA